ncbi:MAG TPA: hypothetical protein VNB90_06160 [Cytophagaceae bacterium]|jgi:hypothetical protein|nr:hypothetical protein [Cytophagaceae bacterium]
MRVKLLLLLIAMPVAMASAQLSGRGYIVSLEGDTLEGFIQVEKKSFYDVVKYKKNKEDRFEKFQVSNLYRIIIKDKIYENLFMNTGTMRGSKAHSSKLCLCLVDGFVKLYKENPLMFYSSSSNLYLSGKNSREFEDNFYVMNGNKDAREIRRKSFVKQSQKALSEYNVIVQSIREKKYGYEDLVNIVNDCNRLYYEKRLNLDSQD